MRTLLAVVDDWELLERIEERFSGTFRILGAPFGAYGLELARQEMPDVILARLGFENMTERELEAELKAEAPLREIPLLLWSDPPTDPLPGSNARHLGARADWETIRAALDAV